MEQNTSTERIMNQPNSDGMVSPHRRSPLSGDTESTPANAADHTSEPLAAKAGWDDTQVLKPSESGSGPLDHTDSPVDAEKDHASADTAAKNMVDATSADQTDNWKTTKYGPGYSDDENEIDYAKGECYVYQDGEYHDDYGYEDGYNYQGEYNYEGEYDYDGENGYDYGYDEGQEGEYTPEESEEEEYPYVPLPWVIGHREHIKRINAIDREQWQRDSDELATQRTTHEEDEAYYKEDAALFADEQDMYVHAYRVDGERGNHDYILCLLYTSPSPRDS